MRCQDAFESLSAALDGELAQPETVSLHQHLSSCETCRHQQQLLGATDARLRAPALHAVNVPEELRARIASRIARPASPPRRRASPLAFAVAFTGAAAAAAAIAIAGPAPSAPPTSDATASGVAPTSNGVASTSSGVATSAGIASTSSSGVATTTTEAAPAGDPTSPPAIAVAPVPGDSVAALSSTLARLASGRARLSARLRGRDCHVAMIGSSPVARACSSGGTREASRVMRTLVNAARARGLRLDCRDCHTSSHTFDLDDGARERFARMLSAIGA